MILQIAQLGQAVLRQKAADIPPEEIATPEFQRLLQDMQETLRSQKGAGLAGPQVFTSRRVFLAGVLSPSTPDGPRGIEVFINPRFTAASAETDWSWEGCLSFPDIREKVQRAFQVTVRAQDEHGTWFEMDGEELLSRAFQHEIDHLDGMLFIFRMSGLKRDMALRRIRKMQREGTW